MAINDTPKGLTPNSPAASNNSSSAFSSTNSPEQVPHDGTTMPPWAILLIVAALIILLISLGIGAYFATKRLRDRRKTHGEYKPQQVEHLQAKDLPYITPPNIEGLI